MRVLFLGPETSPIAIYLRKSRHIVTCRQEPLDKPFMQHLAPDYIVSYGFRYRVEKSILKMVRPGHAINLHISFLPHNRGADPNIWSWVEKSPKGVSIHVMDEGIDTGDLIAQRLVKMHENESLATSYKKLNDAMIELFKWVWPRYLANELPPGKQPAGGSHHTLKDRQRIKHLLTKGWDTPVKELVE